jgi:hypothetical protein
VGGRPQGGWVMLQPKDASEFGLNMIHGPMGQNKVSQHRWQKKGLCTKIMIAAGSDMIWT